VNAWVEVAAVGAAVAYGYWYVVDRGAVPPPWMGANVPRITELTPQTSAQAWATPAGRRRNPDGYARITIDNNQEGY
jgi:hypothetical protein